MASLYDGGAMAGGGAVVDGPGGGPVGDGAYARSGDDDWQISVKETLLELFLEQVWEGADGTLRSPSSTFVVIILSLLPLPPTCNKILICCCLKVNTNGDLSMKKYKQLIIVLFLLRIVHLIAI